MHYRSTAACDLSAGALIEVLDASTATISGNVNNAGTIEAIGGHDGAGRHRHQRRQCSPIPAPSRFWPAHSKTLRNSRLALPALSSIPAPWRSWQPELAQNLSVWQRPQHTPELDVSAGYDHQHRVDCRQRRPSLTANDADFAVLSFRASGGIVNSGTISVKATANLPFDGNSLAKLRSPQASVPGRTLPIPAPSRRWHPPPFPCFRRYRSSRPVPWSAPPVTSAMAV